jgi:hypothetical protein
MFKKKKILAATRPSGGGGASYQSTIIADGASAYWPLDDLSGTTARELIGGKTGNITGGVTLNQTGIGTGGKAMLFNGTTGRISTAATVSTPPNVTLEAWVKQTANAASFVTIASNRSATPLAGELIFALGGSKNMVIFEGAGGNTAGPSILAVDTWYHCVVTCNNTSSIASFYLNGVLDVGNAFIHSTTGSAILSIGFDVSLGIPWFGLLQDVAVYPLILTPAKIAAHNTLRRS